MHWKTASLSAGGVEGSRRHQRQPSAPAEHVDAWSCRLEKNNTDLSVVICASGSTVWRAAARRSGSGRRGAPRPCKGKLSLSATAMCFSWSYTLTFRQISTSTVQIPNHNVAVAQSASTGLVVTSPSSVPKLTSTPRTFPQPANAPSLVGPIEAPAGLKSRLPTCACLSWLQSGASGSLAACLRWGFRGRRNFPQVSLDINTNVFPAH